MVNKDVYNIDSEFCVDGKAVRTIHARHYNANNNIQNIYTNKYTKIIYKYTKQEHIYLSMFCLVTSGTDSTTVFTLTTVVVFFQRYSTTLLCIKLQITTFTAPFLSQYICF